MVTSANVESPPGQGILPGSGVTLPAPLEKSQSGHNYSVDHGRDSTGGLRFRRLEQMAIPVHRKRAGAVPNSAGNQERLLPRRDQVGGVLRLTS
jgi:hypothetical protein